jgi:hypothetical protein
MANRYAVATGNWSNTATWDGGTLPGAGDDVRANGFTVTIDQNITVLSIRNEALAPAVLGGKFLVNSTGRTVNCDIYAANSDCLEIAGFSGTVTVNGNGYATGNNGSAVTVNGVNITINYTGDVYGGFNNSGTATFSNSGLRVFAGNFNFTGNAYGRGGGLCNGIYSNAANSINTFTGNAISNPNTPHQSSGGLVLFGTNHSTTMNGIAENISNLVSVTMMAAVNNAAGSLSGDITAIGSASGTGAGINGAVTANTIIKKSINRIGPGALVNVKYTATSPTIDIKDANDVIVTLSDPAQTNPPIETNVRLGTSYGGGAYIGLLAVPSPSQVSVGIPTDNTTGSAILTSQDLFTAISSSSDPVAERLRNVSTVGTTGDQIVAFFP